MYIYICIHLRNLLPTFFGGIQNKVTGKTAGVGSSRNTCAMASPAAGLEAKGPNKTKTYPPEIIIFIMDPGGV